jgi:hypothetical protein
MAERAPVIITTEETMNDPEATESTDTAEASTIEESGSSRPEAMCTGCGRRPHQIAEYTSKFTDSSLSPEDYVWAEEGTLNTVNGHFLCTECYIRAGQPSSKSGWVAP